jgi:hypothetical protein
MVKLAFKPTFPLEASARLFQSLPVSAMPSFAALTIYAFGLTAFAVGISHLVSPASAIDSLGLPESCIPAANGECAFYVLLYLHR